MIELTKKDVEKAKVLAKAWTKKWVESMRKKGKKLTKKGVKNYEIAMKQIAIMRILTEKSKKVS